MRYLTARDTYTGELEILCKNSICISKCEVCGGCTGSNTMVQQCSYYIKLDIKKCENTQNGGCKLHYKVVTIIRIIGSLINNKIEDK